MQLVFIHGAGGSEATWCCQTSYFNGSEAPGLPGHPEGSPLSSIEEYSAWIHRYLEKRGYHEMVLTGHSMGGGIAISCALFYPGMLSGLILVGAGARLRVNPAIIRLLSENKHQPPDWFRGIAAPMLDRVESSVRTMVLDRQCSMPITTHLNDFLCCDSFDMMEKVGAITIPVLIICGEQDSMTPVKYSKYLADAIPHSHLVVIPEAGHFVFLEKPEVVNREIEAFLSDIGS